MAALAPRVTPYDLGLARQRLIARKTAATPPPDDWAGWLAAVFPGYLWPPYAPYHVAFWQWAWSIEAGESAPPFVAIWPRGFAKSTSVEVATVMLAARQRRSYALYVCATQEQADTHVQNVAGMLESPAFARHFPATSRRRIGKYGASSGWRRNRLRTESGFTLDAIGLDSAARGAKVDEDRPDLIIFDDVDELLDSPMTVGKKIKLITKSILPAGADHAAALVAQNLIHKDGVVAQLADGRADFLAERIVSGPHPALVEPEFTHEEGRWRIVGGASTWAAKPVSALQTELNRIGLIAFRAELQHDVAVSEGALWKLETIAAHRVPAIPEGVTQARTLVGVDPPGSIHGAECGIVVAARGSDKRGYVLADCSRRGSPNEWAIAAVAAYDRFAADAVVIETNQGGDMAVNTLKTVRPSLPVIRVHASRGKAVRAEPVSALAAQGHIAHVGVFPALEDQLTTWVQGMESPDRLDAYVWVLTALLITAARPTAAPVGIGRDSAWIRPGGLR